MCAVLPVLKISSTKLLLLDKDEGFQEHSDFAGGNDVYLTL